MLKWIFLFQSFVYLLLMPALRSSAEFGYAPPLATGLLAIFSLALGFQAYRLRPLNSVTQSTPPGILKPTSITTFLVPVFAVLYAAVVLSEGLLNRRLGSELMAITYAGIPIYSLAILRLYEILFLPIALAYLYIRDVSTQSKIIVGASLLASLPFMGLEDSRGRLLVLAIFFSCFIDPRYLLRLASKNLKAITAGVVAVGFFFILSIRRSQAYASVNEYLLQEVYSRLDGLNLVTYLSDLGYLDWLGQYDVSMFGPLLSKIPFLELAQDAKAMGRTSTKQYYLQDLLGLNQLDAANSMITDPLYFAGGLGLLACFGILGYFIAKFDQFIISRQLFRDAQGSAAAIAFVLSFALIENDFVASCVTFVQNYVLIFLFFLFAFRKEKDTEQATNPSGSQPPIVA